MAGLKRIAESQLTRELSDDDDEIMEVGHPEGFQKADASVLAARPMKGLPKRTNTASATHEVPNRKKFEFGATSSPVGLPTSPFTFNATTPPSEQQTGELTPANPSFKFSSPGVSQFATSTAKQLASILSSPPQPNGIHTTSTSEKSLPSYRDEKYFATLRGLNESLRSQIDKWLEADPFYDLSEALGETYKEYRLKIEKDFKEDWESRVATQVNGVSTTPSPSSNAKAMTDTPKAPAALTMPTPPKAFAGFSFTSSSSSPSTSTPAVGGFKPNFGAKSAAPSSFTFASSPTSGDTSTSTTAPVSDSKPSDVRSSAVASKSASFGGSSSSPFTFGSSSTNLATKPFTSFGAGGSFGGAIFGGKSDDSSTTQAGPSRGKSSSSAGSSTLPPAFGSLGSSSSGFKFGLPSSSGAPTTISFGLKPQVSGDSETAAKSEPVASSSKTTSFGSTSTTSGFSFGSSSGTGGSSSQDATSTTAKSSAPVSAIESRSSTPASNVEVSETEESTTPRVLGENPNDLEGEGEEGEETSACARGKIFKFLKKDTQPTWVETGVGMLRVKRHKTNGSFRLLSRNSANGKIMMNFKVYNGFKMSRNKHILNFVGHENGDSIMFRVRVKDEAGAISLQEAVEKAVSTFEA